jgi:hypothetical protein
MLTVALSSLPRPLCASSDFTAVACTLPDSTPMAPMIATNARSLIILKAMLPWSESNQFYEVFFNFVTVEYKETTFLSTRACYGNPARKIETQPAVGVLLLY